MNRCGRLNLTLTMAMLAVPGLALGECPLFPPDNIWNVRVDHLPVDARSADYLHSIGSGTGLHPDFGAGTWDGGSIGIPYNKVVGSQPQVAITFDYADESDPGPYPIPSNPALEYGSDHHLLIVDQDRCLLYETWDTRQETGGAWQAGSGAIFELRSNALRPAGWTSADAAGLPILPGLARCEEVTAGVINHALRFTAQRTQHAYVWPARHDASSITDPSVPPMGQRFRLKADFDLSGYSPQTQVILTALKTYGMMLADNGSNWYLSGTPGACWNDEALVAELRTVTGANFEAVDVSGLMVHPDSAQARDETAVQNLIQHYYQSILSRPLEPEGLAYWEGEIARIQGLGIAIQDAFRVMAGQFFTSSEYLNQNVNDVQYVTDLYETFFNRNPDSDGLSYWTGQLIAGLPRSVVLFYFLFSDEFTATLQSTFGDTASRSEIATVVDFYRGFLNRLPDDAGFAYWLNRFRLAQCQGASAVTAEVERISAQFMASGEYAGRQRDHRDFIADLYYTFLRRGGESAGFQYWVNRLDSNTLTPDTTRQAFIQTPEFQNRVAQMINEGCLD